MDDKAPDRMMRSPVTHASLWDAYMAAILPEMLRQQSLDEDKPLIKQFRDAVRDAQMVMVEVLLLRVKAEIP